MKTVQFFNRFSYENCTFLIGFRMKTVQFFNRFSYENCTFFNRLSCGNYTVFIGFSAKTVQKSIFHIKTCTFFRGRLLQFLLAQRILWVNLFAKFFTEVGAGGLSEQRETKTVRANLRAFFNSLSGYPL